MDSAAARAACSAYVREQHGALALGTGLLGGPLAEDLRVILTWHLLLQQQAAIGDLQLELMGWRAALSEAFSPDPRRLLARALRPTLRDHALPEQNFQECLEGHALLHQIGSFETREHLLGQARSMTQGTALSLLSILGCSAERQEIMARALASALQLIHWLGATPACLAHGYLPLAVDDLTRHGLNILSLRNGEESSHCQALVADQIQWIRELLAKGWPLCLELDWYRGRLLAYQLRKAAASLGALEAGSLSLFAPAPRGGWMRNLACLGASAIKRSAPPLARDIPG